MTTDIVERLRGDSPSVLAMRDAANEIECLAGKIISLENYIEMAHQRDSAEIERLRAAAQQARAALEVNAAETMRAVERIDALRALDAALKETA